MTGARPSRSPAISVAMSVYNGERFLAEAVESVLQQSFRDFEFLILDDGSSDSSVRIARDHASRDSRIRVISRENRGLVASLNQLLAESRGALVARMDADDVCMPQRFERQFAFLSANPDYGVVGSWSEDIGEDGLPWQDDRSTHPVTHDDVIASIDASVPFICHPAVMYRRDTVLSVGGYHAAYRHCEDLDLWLRLAGVTRIGNLPERLLRYRHYEGQVSNRHATEQAYGAAIARLAWRERAGGRTDPTANLDRLPPPDGLDALFGRPGVAEEVVRATALSLLHSPVALRDEGFDFVLTHARRGQDRQALWRTVARLVRFGEPGRAATLGRTLVAA